MFQSLLRRLALRSALLVVLIHAGTLLALLGLAALPRTDATLMAWNLIAAGIAVLYGSFLICTFWVAWPLFTLARRIRRLLRWKDWILDELPRIIAMIPQVVQAFREAFTPRGDSATGSAKPDNPGPTPSS